MVNVVKKRLEVITDSTPRHTRRDVNHFLLLIASLRLLFDYDVRFDVLEVSLCAQIVKTLMSRFNTPERIFLIEDEIL